MPNIPEDLEPPRSATAPNRTLALRTKQVEGLFVRDVEILAIGWHADPAAPMTYLVFDPREEEDARVYWVRGDFAQQIRHA